MGKEIGATCLHEAFRRRQAEVAPTHAIDLLSLENSRFRKEFGMTHFLRRDFYGYATERKILGEMEKIFSSNRSSYYLLL
jgi:hypothetical protein